MADLIPGKDYIGVGCGALIVNSKGEVLLMKRGPNAKNDANVWCQPGGAVEFDEPIQSAVIREIKEELDIDIKLIHFLAFTDQHVDGQHWLAISYLAKIIKGEPRILEPHKHSELAWFSPQNAPSPLAVTTIDSIKAYKNLNERH